MLSDLSHRFRHFLFDVVFKLGVLVAPPCVRGEYLMALQFGSQVIDRLESQDFVDMLGPDFNPGNED